jgi:peptidyl-tRNA hydrolase, PTH1 family
VPKTTPLPGRERGPRDRTSRPRTTRYFFNRRRKNAEAPEGTAGEASKGTPSVALRSPVVAGLGNPGRSYERTRHNLGYLTVEELARRHDGSWRSRKKAEAAPVAFGAKNVLLLKPTTFMNRSGSALADVRLEDLIVVHDELDLEPGTVRVKVGGGAGGHNGLRSIIQNLGNDFVRVRIGIGRPPVGVTVTDYVLGRLDAAVRDAVPTAADAVEVVLDHGPEVAMNRYNVRA